LAMDTDTGLITASGLVIRLEEGTTGGRKNETPTVAY
jgi:hypothetical protein